MSVSIMQVVLDIAAELPMTDASVQRRLDRAEAILAPHSGYEITPQHGLPGFYAVRRLSTSMLEDNGQTYFVTPERCTCPDYEAARGHLCKHRLAVMLLERMNSV